jgi:hypothetical protein
MRPNGHSQARLAHAHAEGARLRRPSGTEAQRIHDPPEGGSVASWAAKGDAPGGTTVNQQGDWRLTGVASGWRCGIGRRPLEEEKRH